MIDIDVIDKRKSAQSISMEFRLVPRIEEYFACRRIDWLHWIVDIKPKLAFDFMATLVGLVALLWILG